MMMMMKVNGQLEELTAACQTRVKKQNKTLKSSQKLLTHLLA